MISTCYHNVVKRTHTHAAMQHTVSHTHYQVIHQLISTDNVQILRETARAEKAEPAPQLYHSEKHHPAPPRPAPPRTAPHRTAPHRTAPHRTAPHRTAPHRTAPHRTAPHRTAPHRTGPQQIKNPARGGPLVAVPRGPKPAPRSNRSALALYPLFDVFGCTTNRNSICEKYPEHHISCEYIIMVT